MRAPAALPRDHPEETALLFTAYPLFGALSTELQSRSVASNLPRRESSEEENLLIEAVSLLVQRQRDAEERYADLENRLADIERQLSRVAPSGTGGERLALLREQLAELRAEPEARPVRVTTLEPRRQAAPAPAPAADGPSRLIGSTPRQRFALLLIAVGVLAVLYSAFLLIRFG